MLERLVHLIVRLKEVLLKVEERQHDSASGNSPEIALLNAEVFALRKDQADALKALDELERVIKKWEL